MQKEIITKGELLSKSGALLSKGWAKQPLLNYNRNAIKANAFRIKEWDYYAIVNDEFALGVTIADLSYVSMVVVSIMDFKELKEYTKLEMIYMTRGNLDLPSSPNQGDISVKKGSLSMQFLRSYGNRKIIVRDEKFYDGKALDLIVELEVDEEQDTTVIVTPFNNPKQFYYNQKVNNQKAKGIMRLGSKVYDFTSKESYGVLDWGRGVWSYKNKWYWGSASGKVNGKLFGFNIGYGFGDTSMASENIIFYDGKAHKLEEVTFHIDEESFMKTWRFTSSDGRFELSFEPVYDRNSKTNLFVVQSSQHQVFGYFSGKVILDDGQEIVLEKFFGFAEEVMNKW